MITAEQMARVSNIEDLTAGIRNGNGQHLTPEALDDADLPVCVTEEKPCKFPAIAWSGFFSRWRETVAPCTEAALETLWATGLLAAGMVIGRRAYRESPRALYPNFYVMILGQTGDSRKSTTMWLACELLRHVGEEFKDLDGVVSSEGIYEALSAAEGTKGLIYADEFRAFLSVAKRKGTQDIIPRLNSLYYCPARASIDRVKDSTEIIKPFLSMVTATPQAYVDDLLTDLEITGGFLNRFLIIAGDEQPPKAIVRSPSPVAWESIAAELRKIRDREYGNLEFGEDALGLWTDFYNSWKHERRDWNPKQANLTARIFEHVLKIAVVYSVLAAEPEISGKSLAIAIEIGGWLQSNTLKLFADTGLDHFGKCERAVIDLLKRAKDGQVWRRDLQQAMSKKGFNAEIFNRAIRALESNDVLFPSEIKTMAGRTRLVVHYIREQVTRNSAPDKDSTVTCSREKQT